MCIMEVRRGQRTSTMLQACAHNIGTVIADMDMLRQLLGARGDEATLNQCTAVQSELRQAYNALLQLYGENVAGDLHVTDDEGGERTRDEVVAAAMQRADEDERRARRYETR